MQIRQTPLTQTLRTLIAPTLALAVGIPAAQAAESDTVVLKGEVDRFSTIDRDNQERGLLRVKLANGRTAIVDVGERRDVETLDIEQGDHIRIEGAKSRSGESRSGEMVVLNASRLQIKDPDGDISAQGRSRSEFRNIPASQRRSNDRTPGSADSEISTRQSRQSDRNTLLQGVSRSEYRNITQSERRRGSPAWLDDDSTIDVENLNDQDRSLQQGTSRSEHRNLSASQRRVDYSGTVVGTRSHRGAAGEATLVELQLENGRSAYVVVPPQFDLDRVAISDADRVRVGGVQRSDRNYVVAQRLRVDGQDVRVQKSKAGQQRDAGQQQSDRGHQRGMATLQGTVESFSRKRLQNAPEDNVFVKVRLQDGSTRIVDFGPISNAKLIRMQAGDQVRIKGQIRKLGDRQVLEARSVRIQSEESQNRRMMRSGLERATVKNQSDPMTLKGTVEGVKKVRLQGQDGKVAVMKIKLQDGSSRIVNLTPRLAKQILDIEAGDTVVASGYKRQVNERTVGIIDGIIVLEGEDG